MASKNIFIVLLLLFPSIIYAQKWEKMLGKADQYYSLGDYGKASAELAKFQKKLIKELGSNNEYMPDLYVRQAKFNLATGVMVGFETMMDNAASVSEKYHGKESIEHAKNTIEIASMLVSYGYLSRARHNLEEAGVLLTSTGNMTDDLKAAIGLDMARILSGQGFYDEALSFINANEQYFRGRTAAEESYIDDSGKLKSRKLDKQELINRYKDYATILTLKANTFRHIGHVHRADSAFMQAEVWIDKNMGKDTEEYIRNQFYNAQMFEENGMKELPKHLSYDKLLNHLKRKYNEAHTLAFELYESQLKEYLRNEQRARFNTLAVEYQRAIKKNFDKKSIHRIILETVDFEERLKKGNTSDLYSDATKIIGDKTSLPAIHPKTAEIYEYIYRASLINKHYTIAEQALKKVLDIRTELYGEDSPQLHLARILYANYLLDYTDKLQEAGKIYTESWEQVVKKQINFRHKDYLDIQNHLAKYYELTDQHKLASAALKQSSEAAIQKYDNTDSEYGISLEHIANLRLKLGEYDEAANNIKQSLAILENFSKDDLVSLDLARAIETNAHLLAIQGYFDEAESNLERSQSIVKKSEVKTGSDLMAKEELAALYLMIGKYTDAGKILDEILVEYEKLYGSSSRRLINPLTYQGQLKLINGDYPEAEKFAQKARTIAETSYGKSSTKLAPTLKLLTELYITIGDYDKAEVYVKDAINIQEKNFGRSHIDVAFSLTQYGLIKFYRGDNLSDTEKKMIEARDIIKAKLGDRNPFYADILNDIAKIYISQHRYDDAFNALALAEVIWQTKTGRRNNINLASIYVLTGDIYYQQRLYEQSEENYEKARKLYQKFFHKNHPEYVKVISKLGKLYYMEGDSRKAKEYIEEALENYAQFIKDYFPALSEREKAKFWNTINADYEFYSTLAFKLKDSNKEMVANVFDNALLTKALLLNSAIKTRENILKSNDEQLKSKFLLWLEKKEYLTNILSLSPDQLITNGINPVAINDEIEQLEKELSASSEVFSKQFDEEAIDWKKVQASLKENEVAVEMVRYRYFDHTFTDSVVYAAIYISGEKKHSTPEVILLDNGGDLEQKYFKFYRNSIMYRIPDPYSYDQYWRRIEERIGSYSTIYLSADGVYNQINLEAIPLGNGKYVIDNSNIILVSNTKDIYKNKVTTHLVQHEKSALMFGNPEFYLTASASNKISPLPGTEKEIISLNDILQDDGWKINYYMEKVASEDKIKMLDNPKIFHVATHGFYTPKEEQTDLEEIVLQENEATQNPLLRTGLLFSGAGDLLDKTTYNYNLESGILTAYEAMNLNLDRTELVVLSACETGLGDLAVGEGVYGLQRAFLVAGAKTLIMSMFKVDDQATQELMETFYRKWLLTGKKRQSFIEAKKEIRNKYKDPIFWGAFIMIGLE